MRLINAHTLEIHEFIDVRNTPNYVILSHCWGDNEVSFKEYTKWKNQDGAGYKKIIECCAFARRRGQQWVWIDTCCIDKRSSAELSEAINSMYEWYERAEECYAYLADITLPLVEISDGSTMLPKLRSSRWFKRGWTLQELIAPQRVVFLARHWEPIGYVGPMRPRGPSNYRCLSVRSHRQNGGLELTQTIATITGVPADLIKNADILLSDYSVAQRFSWMKGRRTTRIEDMAYCLMGLFKINMPLLYGEGARAFGRLQSEIMSRTGDESVFAFAAEFQLQQSLDLYADDPSAFADAGNVRRLQSHDRPPLLMSSRWAELSPAAQQVGVFRHTLYRNINIVRLNCAKATTDGHMSPCMMVVDHAKCGHCVRKSSRSIERFDFNAVIKARRSTTIMCEADLKNADEWVPNHSEKTMLIHLTVADVLTCAKTQENTGSVRLTLRDDAQTAIGGPMELETVPIIK